MKKVLFLCGVLMGLALLNNSVSEAALLYDNGVGADGQTSGYYSSEYRGWRVYDDFSLGAASSIDSVWFQQGTTPGSGLDSFTFSVYSDASALPGSLLFTQFLAIGDYAATPNGIASYPFGQFYDIEFDIDSSLSLAAGDYWVSFYGMGSTDFRTPNVGSGNGFYQEGLYSAIKNGDTPFRLYSATDEQQPPVPEPATVLLFGAGVLGFFRLRKKA